MYEPKRTIQNEYILKYKFHIEMCNVLLTHLTGLTNTVTDYTQ